MGDTKLLPCPCCGSAAKFMQDHRGDCSKTWIECFGCSLQSAQDHWMRDDSEIRAKLAAAWNRRPALLARQEGEDWLPIESAPRDGSVIDLFGRERFASCFWDAVSKEWRQYYSEAIPCSFSISDETPTHWRRLPAAPAARSVSGG